MSLLLHKDAVDDRAPDAVDDDDIGDKSRSGATAHADVRGGDGSEEAGGGRVRGTGQEIGVGVLQQQRGGGGLRDVPPPPSK